MKCPIDETELQMTERQGVEIDYCPKCRGVWLDRGELDKIIDRTATATSQESPQVLEPHQDERSQRDEYSHYEHGHKKHKRGGLLGELFDF